VCHSVSWGGPAPGLWLRMQHHSRRSPAQLSCSRAVLAAYIYRGFVRKADRVHTFILLLFASYAVYQIAVKIKPLYLTNNTRYLTSNTTRVVQ
jgi:hypothetical protein